MTTDSSETVSNAIELLQEIAHCSVIADQLANPGSDHNCGPVIRIQGASPLDARQLPEPWSGNLCKAPVLFISSNPSINLEEEYPTGGWPEAQIADFFEHRFGDGHTEWTRDGLHPLRADGTFAVGAWVHFWAAVRARATELLDRPAVPGKDYALSEVVHCKSEGEDGVCSAAEFCASRYLKRIVSASAARVIVSLGKVASLEMRRVFGLDLTAVAPVPVRVGDKERHFVFLPHPNSFGPKSFGALVDEYELARLRGAL